jgi:hypothetical protein
MAIIRPDSCSLPQLGPYRIHGKRSGRFGSFYEFQLKFRPGENQLTAKYNQDRDLLVTGKLYTKPSKDMPKANVESYSELTADGKYLTRNVIKFRFETATLTCESGKAYRLTFKTETIQGIYYCFKGEFLTQPKLVDGMYVSLAGRMVKRQNDRILEESDLTFVNWSHE